MPFVPVDETPSVGRFVPIDAPSAPEAPLDEQFRSGQLSDLTPAQAIAISLGRSRSRTDPEALLSAIPGVLGSLAQTGGRAVAEAPMAWAMPEEGAKALAEGALRGSQDLGQVAHDVVKHNVGDPIEVIHRAVKELGLGGAIQAAASRPGRSLAGLIVPGFSPTMRMAGAFPQQAADVTRESLLAEREVQKNRQALSEGKRSLLGEIGTAAASGFDIPLPSASELGFEGSSPLKSIHVGYSPGVAEAVGQALAPKLTGLAEGASYVLDPTLLAGLAPKAATLAERVAMTAEKVSNAAKLLEHAKSALVEIHPASPPLLSGPPLDPVALQSKLDNAVSDYSRMVNALGKTDPGAAQKVVGQVGEKFQNVSGLLKGSLDAVHSTIEKIEAPLSIATAIAGAAHGGAAEGVIAGALPKIVKHADVAADVLAKAGSGLRALANADWKSQLPVWRQIAKNPDAPAWLVKGVTAPVWRSLTVGGLVEGAAKGSQDVARGALHGAGVGAGMTIADPQKSGEEIGGAMAAGGLLGGLGGIAAHPTSRQARVADAFAHDAMVTARESIAGGADPVVIAQTPNSLMANATTYQTFLRAFLPGGKDVKVRLTDEAGFRAVGGDAQAALWDPTTRTAWVNVQAHDAAGRMVHELDHAITAPGDPATIDLYTRLLGPDGIEKAKQDYINALGLPPDQATAYRQALEAQNGPSWIVHELSAESAAHLLRAADPAGALPSVLGRSAEGATTFFRDPSVLAAVTDPRALEYARQRFAQAQDYRPAVDAGNPAKGQKLNLQDAGNHPALPVEPRANGSAGNDFVEVTPGGRRIVVPPAQVARRVRSRRKEMQTLFPDGAPVPHTDTSPDVQTRVTPSGLVQKTGTRLGDAFYNTAQTFGAQAKEMLRKVEDAITNGSTLGGWYQQIGNGEGWAGSVREHLGALEAQYKDFLPYAFRVDNQGNLLIQNYSLSALERKANDWAQRHGPISLDLWGGDIGAFKADVQTYLKNHANGLPGSTGIGEGKRDAINAFTVGGNRTYEIDNRLRPLLKGKDRQGIVRAYRADRLQTAEPSEVTGFAQPQYGKQVRNLSPNVLQATPGEVVFNLTAATGSLPGLDRLTREAVSGDAAAAHALQGVSYDSLKLLMSGIPGASIEHSGVTGVFEGSAEPALQVKVKAPAESMPQVLAAAERFASNFNQWQIHRREPVAEGAVAGKAFPDGSFHTPVYQFETHQPLSTKEIADLAAKAGLSGFTADGTLLEAYYADDHTNPASLTSALQSFGDRVRSVPALLGSHFKAAREGVARLWRYGREDSGPGVIPYATIRGDVHPTAQGDNAVALRIAERLRGSAVKPEPQAKSLTMQQVQTQAKIAREFEALPMNDLGNPAVKRAYRELRTELLDQYDSIPIKVELYQGQGQPYSGSPAMRKDVMENNHLWIYATRPESFGAPGADYTGHPLLEPTPFKDVNGHPLLTNDLLRAVHDYYAHTLSPVNFGALGEEAAWKNHLRMTRSPWARMALTTETRGQNSTVNFGKNGEHNRANPTQTIFADQKVGLLDPEWSKIGDPELDRQIDAIAPEVRASRGAQASPQVVQRDLGKNSAFAVPPTDNEARAALDSAKKPMFGQARNLEEGTPVALRIDIPAFNRTGKYVVTVHEPGPSGGPGKVLGYDTVARIEDPRFTVKPGVEKIRSGEANKFPVATVDGSFVPDRRIPKDIDQWTPVGMDPKEHSFFYDKRDDRMVVGGKEAISVGNTVFVREPVYGDRDAQKYSPKVNDGERGFYSKLERVVDTEVKGDSIPAVQLKAILRNRGVKAEELKWTQAESVIDRLAGRYGGKVPKAQLLEELRVRRPKFDTESGTPTWTVHDSNSSETFKNKEEAKNAREEWIDTLAEDQGDLRVSETDDGDGKFSIVDSWGDPAGIRHDNGEVLLRRGARFDSEEEAEEALNSVLRAQAEREVSVEVQEQEPQFEQWTLPGGHNYREIALVGPSLEKWDGGSAHDFTEGSKDDINQRRVAHMRVKDRELQTTEGTKQPGLFIEEIQSDRHQAAREKGYSSDINSGTGVPDAPFRKDWALQMFKRALRDAVESGKQWIGWTDGQTQADRYDLSTQVQSLEIRPLKDNGVNKLTVYANGQLIQHTTPDNLSSVVGKDLARKALADLSTGKDAIYSGLDLKIGGEGMRAFYDQILPAEVSKYVKKWGATVEKGRLGPPPDQGPEFWKVSLSPETAKAIRAEGQERFSPKVEARDTAYLKAAKEGNTEVAQRFVDRAAREAGYVVGPVYHGTPTGGFHVFDKSMQGETSGVSRRAFSFTTNKEAAESYSRHLSDNSVRLDAGLRIVNNAMRKFDSDRRTLEYFNGKGFDSLALESLPEFDWGSIDDTSAFIGDLKDYARELKEINPELSEAFLKGAKATAEAKAAPEVKRVFLRVPENAPVFKATPQTIGAVMRDFSARAEPTKSAIVELPGNERIYYVADSDQIKSADPVTHDDAGNIIPLSKRFDAGNEDIRYSPKVPAPEYLEKVPGARVYAAKLVPDNEHKYVNVLLSDRPTSVQKNALVATPEKRTAFFGSLDSALSKISNDPARLASTAGYVEFMRDAGISGDVMAAPPMLKTILETPQKYVDLVTGGYHGDKTVPGTLEAAMGGLDATVEMRKAIVAANPAGAPPPLVTALHHFWGIMSRRQPPLDQEACWLRLVSQPAILEQIQRSIDGTYNLPSAQWDDLVTKGLAATKQDNKLGNNAKSNANSFDLMLNRWNGKWDQAGQAYATPSALESGRRFWGMDAGPVGIKNKVQRFVGLTFGTPGLIMDRWKFVEFYMGQFGGEPKDFFRYDSNGTPEDPASLYNAYGGVESASPTLSLAYYEGMETALQKAIDNSRELQQLLGRHANVGGLHWVGWNAIKNEAVGHSSLGLTYDLLKRNPNPTSADVLALIQANEYYTEGLQGSTLKKFTLKK